MSKNIKEQIEEFDKLIKRYPNVKEFYIGKAKLYEEMKQYKKALKSYKKLYEDYICYDIASICEQKGLMEEAEEFYTKDIKKNKKNIKNYIKRAYFYIRIRKIDEAISDFKKVFEIPIKNKNILMVKQILSEELKLDKKTLPTKD